MMLQIEGLGIILYSPRAVAHIAPGEDYLTTHYWNPSDVQQQIQAGSIVGFATGSPGTFILEFLQGCPSDNLLESSDFKLRLGVKVDDQGLCVRDLYDLMDWDPSCSPEQTVRLDRGVYMITLCSSRPASGILGDHQTILVYLQPLPEMPLLSIKGVPALWA